MMSVLTERKYLHLSKFHGVDLHYDRSIKSLTVVRYPDGLAWQFNVPKKVLRKQPEFKKFHSFLVFETEVVC
jgi:multisite-specific tRNA:(cytosine-C5)-methyltransferase